MGTKIAYAVVQCGWIGAERYEARETAQSEADRWNAEADEEIGEELIGDGAASVVEIESDDDGTCPRCGHPTDNSSGHGTCAHRSHR
jgi:hypothetical protein